jgi:hypothetical protein
LWPAIVWLLISGPVSGLILARTTGAMSWGRALGWVVACQTIAVVLYVLLQPLPIRSFSKMPTARDILYLKTLFALGVIIVGLALGAIAIALWRTIHT